MTITHEWPQQSGSSPGIRVVRGQEGQGHITVPGTRGQPYQGVRKCAASTKTWHLLEAELNDTGMQTHAQTHAQTKARGIQSVLTAHYFKMHSPMLATGPCCKNPSHGQTKSRLFMVLSPYMLECHHFLCFCVHALKAIQKKALTYNCLRLQLFL